MENAVVTENLGKRFSAFQALEGVSLNLPKGSVLGLVGPNGAGKSTFMRILLGLYRMTSGKAEVLGYDVLTQSHLIRARAGYVPDRLSFSWETVLDLITGFAYLQGFSFRESRRKAREVLEEFDAHGYRKKRYRNLSDGMKKRAILALASVHDPSIYLMDEPTSNLDVMGVQSLRTLIKRKQAEGVSVILATHRARFIQDLCDRLAILLKGRLLFQGGTKEFIDKMIVGDMLIRNPNLNNARIEPKMVERLGLKALGNYTVVPRDHWDDFQRITGMSTEKLGAKPEPRSLSYAIAKCYALGIRSS